MNFKNPIPVSPQSWLKEIAKAYLDAIEILPFGKLTGQRIDRKNLYQLGPAICIKFRGVRNSKDNLKKATDAALYSFVASEKLVGKLFDTAQVSFAFCYLASHYGLGILDEKTLDKNFDYIEKHVDDLVGFTSS